MTRHGNIRKIYVTTNRMLVDETKCVAGGREGEGEGEIGWVGEVGIRGNYTFSRDITLVLVTDANQG